MPVQQQSNLPSPAGADGGNSDKKDWNWKRAPGLVTTRRITLLGLSLVIVGDNILWNKSYDSLCFVDYMATMLILGTALLCAACCLAEMTGALPFPGGIYGFVRVTFGAYFGFIIGCCEVMQNLVYTAAYIIPIGELLAFSLDLNPLVYAPLIAFLFLIVTISINLVGGKVFWNLNTALSLLSVLIVLLYICCAIPHANFHRNSYHPAEHQSVSRRMMNSLKYLNQMAWFFGGIEMIPLTCNDAIKPRKTVSRSIINTTVILMFFAIALVTLGASLSPGPQALSEEILPLVPGFMQGLKLPAKIASILVLPGLVVSAYTFVYIYGKQIRSMAESKLLPQGLHLIYGEREIPYTAILLGSIVVLLLLCVYFLLSKTTFNEIVSLTNQASYLIYLSVPCCYLVFKKRYDNLPKAYVSPVGTYGAIYSIMVLGIAALTTLTLNEKAVILVPCFVGIILLLSLYYFVYARTNQGFSKEEQKILFAAYVINANRRSKLKLNMKKGTKSMSSFHGKKYDLQQSFSKESNTVLGTFSSHLSTLSRIGSTDTINIHKSILPNLFKPGSSAVLPTFHDYSDLGGPEDLPSAGEQIAMTGQGSDIELGEKPINSLTSRQIAYVDQEMPKIRSPASLQAANVSSNNSIKSGVVTGCPPAPDDCSINSFNSLVREGTTQLRQRSSFLFPSSSTPTNKKANGGGFSIFSGFNCTAMEGMDIYDPQFNEDWQHEEHITHFEEEEDESIEAAFHDIKQFISTLYDDEEVSVTLSQRIMNQEKTETIAQQPVEEATGSNGNSRRVFPGLTIDTNC